MEIGNRWEVWSSLEHGFGKHTSCFSCFRSKQCANVSCGMLLRTDQPSVVMHSDQVYHNRSTSFFIKHLKSLFLLAVFFTLHVDPGNNMKPLAGMCSASKKSAPLSNSWSKPSLDTRILVSFVGRCIATF